MAAAGARPHRSCNAILMQQVCVDVVTGRGAVITVSDLFHFSWVLHQHADAPHSNWCVKKKCFYVSSCLHSFSLPPPQKNSCLTACFFVPWKHNVSKTWKAACFSSVRVRGATFEYGSVHTHSSTPKMSPGTAYTVHLGVIFKWKGMLKKPTLDSS